MIRFHSLAPWVATSLFIAALDLILPPVASICALQVVLQLAAFRWLAASRAVKLTGLLAVTTFLPGMIRPLIQPRIESNVVADSPNLFLDPLRTWVVLALGVAVLFHADLQRVRKRRLRLRQQLQRKVQRRSVQVRRSNDALRREVARRQATQQRLMRTETHLQSLAQRMELQVLRKDKDGVITYANDAFCKNVGRSVNSVIGSTDADLYPPATAEKYRSDDFQVMASGIPVDHVESHPTADGKTGWVQVFKAAEYDDQERCIGIQMVFWDVTDTYWRTAELRRSEARKRALFDAAREAVMLVDANGRIVEANPAAESLLGRGPSSVAGCLIESVAVPDSPITAESFGESKATAANHDASSSNVSSKVVRWQDLPASERRELTIRRYDGSTFPAEVSVHPIPLESSQGLAVFIRDVTLRHQAIRALRAAKQAAEDASRTKSEFMASVSHEIRTPLGGITGSAELLSQMALPNRAMQYVNMIRQSSELLSGVIGDILDFASIEAGRLQVNPEPTDLHRCVGEAFKCLAPRATGNDIELVIDISPAVPRQVMVDAKRLRQIVVNLAGNAIKFTPRGYVMLRMTTDTASSVRSLDTNDARTGASIKVVDVVIEIVDSGIGIAKELHEKIFEPFEQGDSSTTRRYGGTGLGLSISRQLIQQMGGSIGVTSRPGHGSTFRCTLPLSVLSTNQHPTSCAGSFSHAALNQAVSIEVSHPIQRRVISELVSSSGGRVDRKGRIRIIDRNPANLNEYNLKRNASVPGVANSQRVIWLAKVDDATAPMCQENEIILVKPVMPGDLFQAIELSASTTSMTTESRRPQTSGSNEDLLATTMRSASQAISVSNATGNAKILVVDDSEVNRTVIRDFLSLAGYDADIVDCGQSAIKATERVQYQCILMDLQMPDLDGVETMQIICDRCCQRGISPPPVVALTAHATEEHRARCLEAGMKSFLVKPIDPSMLISVVRQFVETNASVAIEEIPRTTEIQPPLEKHWEQKLLATVGGNPKTMLSIAEAFVLEVPQLCQNLKKSLAEGDSKETRRAAHTLKSCLKYVAPEVDWKPMLDIEYAAEANDLKRAKEISDRAISIAESWTTQVSNMIQARNAK